MLYLQSYTWHQPLPSTFLLRSLHHPTHTQCFRAALKCLSDCSKPPKRRFISERCSVRAFSKRRSIQSFAWPRAGHGNLDEGVSPLGTVSKVCKSLRIGSKVLKTIGMQTHGEKNSCSTVQPCFNTHGREFLAGSPLPHPCSQSVVAGWLWCLANQAPWHQLGPRVPGAQAWVMATSQGVAAAQGIWEQHASMGTHSSGCDTFCWWKVANYNSIQNFVKTQEWMSKPTDPPSPTWYSQVRPLKWL